MKRQAQTARLTADTDQNYAVLMLLIRRDLKTALHVSVIVLYSTVSSCVTDCNF